MNIDRHVWGDIMAIKRLLFIFGLIFFFIQSAALAGPAAPSAAPGQGPRYVWKSATLAPRGIGYAKQFEEILLPAIEKETNGELEVKVFWGGVMGDDKEVLKKMHQGILQAAGLSGQGTFLLSPEIAVLGLPFLFNDFCEVDFIKGKTAERFDAITMEHGFKIMLWLDQDFDQIYSSKSPMITPANFRKARFASWYGPLDGLILDKLGASATLMDVTEIPDSVRSGETDAVFAPSIWVSGTQLYSIFRYINPMKIRYVPAFVVASAAAWRETDPKYHPRLTEVRLDLSKRFCEKTREDTARYLKAMEQYGLTCQTPSPQDMEQIRAAVMPVWEELAGTQYPKALLDEITAHLEKFRRTKT